MCQIAAEELGVPVEDVEISRADTDLTTFCLGAFASRLTYVSGNAVKNAATNVKQQLFEQAAEMLEANAADLMSRDGRIFVKGAEGKSVTVADVARAGLFRHNGAPIVGSGSFDADSVLPDSTRFGNESGAYNYGVQAAQVHVDPETGQVKVLQLCRRVGLRHGNLSDRRRRPSRRRFGSRHRLRAHRRFADRRRTADQP